MMSTTLTILTTLALTGYVVGFIWAFRMLAQVKAPKWLAIIWPLVWIALRFFVEE